MTNFDYSKLRGRIKAKFKTQNSFADELGLGRVSLSQRLNGKLEFSQNDIMKSIKLLNIDPQEITDYFFTIKV